jgi:hypothetical protein
VGGDGLFDSAVSVIHAGCCPRTFAGLELSGGGGKVSASTQNQALAALLFLYRHVLRDAFAGIRIRHPHYPGVARSQDVSTTMVYTHVLIRPQRRVPRGEAPGRPLPLESRLQADLFCP